MSTSRPLLTQREAATACGVSRSTIRRRREAGELPGAVLDDERGWLIPVEDLLAAGFRLNAPAPPDPDSETAPAEAGADPEAARGEIDELRAELERLRSDHVGEQHARALAELENTQLRERLQERAAHIADLQQALAALAPAPERAAIPQPSPPAVAETVTPDTSPDPDAGTQEETRRRWWPRRR